MRVRLLILAVLAPFLASCGDSGPPCPLDDHPFEVDGSLAEHDITSILEGGYGAATREQISCEMACEYGLRRSGEPPQFTLTGIDTCEHTIDAASEDMDAIVGDITCTGTYREYCLGGRRPLGHVERTHAGCSLADYLADCAHMEAASVTAFEELAVQLAEWAAPADLVERCRRAALDESRHAAQLGALAARAGADVPPPVQRPCDASRLAVALHNATEGCVHEAWAAVHAAWTARRAADPGLRAVYLAIADDEAGHAQLAWDLHTWLMSQLDEDQRDQVRAAQRAALAELPHVAGAQATRTPGDLGLPPAAALRDMATRFAAGLAA